MRHAYLSSADLFFVGKIKELKTWHLALISVFIILFISWMVVELINAFYSTEKFGLFILVNFLVLGFNIDCAISGLICYSIAIKVPAEGVSIEALRSKVCYMTNGRKGDREIITDGIRIQLDGQAVMNVTLRNDSGRSMLNVRASPTLETISIMFILFILIPVGGVAVLFHGLKAYEKARRFTHEELEPMMASSKAEEQEQEGPGLTYSDRDVNSKMVETVSRLQHLVFGANKATINAYQERLVLLLVAIPVILVVSLAYSFGQKWPLELVLIAELIILVPFLIASLYRLRRHYRPLITELNDWERWLATARQVVDTSAVRSDPEGTNFSVLEMVMLASKQVPRWIKLRSGNMFVRSPRATIIIAGLIVLGWNMRSLQGYLGDLYYAILASFIGLGIIIFIIVKLGIKAEDKVKLSHWQERIERLMSQIQNSFEGD
ncbi:MAG: hypothetical protein A4E32_01302 [Methanomassiliicoccales archaeon PtaU1.Bin124]|nr:MAG: hypothetical protein A4E32_01302 [Methanomassiliicoccales archaeon PtaU1.Bin124]